MGEIVDTHPLSSTDNMGILRLALENLKQYLADNLITPEDYEREKRKILDQYSI